jgi:hypothetical protein
MPRTYGNCGPVVTATRGIELPRPGAPRLDVAAILARRAARPADVRRVGGPVRCDVCALPVAADWVARTGLRRHRPCQDRADARAGLARSGVRAVA